MFIFVAFANQPGTGRIFWTGKLYYHNNLGKKIGSGGELSTRAYARRETFLRKKCASKPSNAWIPNNWKIEGGFSNLIIIDTPVDAS